MLCGVAVACFGTQQNRDHMTDSAFRQRSSQPLQASEKQRRAELLQQSCHHLPLWAACVQSLGEEGTHGHKRLLVLQQASVQAALENLGERGSLEHKILEVFEVPRHHVEEVFDQIRVLTELVRGCQNCQSLFYKRGVNALQELSNLRMISEGPEADTHSIEEATARGLLETVGQGGKQRREHRGEMLFGHPHPVLPHPA
mmetsp:Transcript_17392/g.24384  ORF Transcript_17392/g.24384 Transcript_17392/m.24384 type:complete len:200 (+) Transcript_17392:158-757(+)